MLKFVSVLSVLLLIFTAVPAYAQYERFRLPEGTRLTHSGQQYQAYNLGEYRELLHMDEDLRYLTELNALQQARIAELTVSVTNLQTALHVAQESIEILRDERTRLTAMWTEENRLRHAAEQRPDWNWIPWTLSAGLAVVVVILSIVIGAGG